MEEIYGAELISICMPAYNAEQYIRQTIGCFLNQTYNNFELIIVDDGSTDETYSILNSIKDSRITILSNPKKNASSARNYAYEKSKGNYIIFFDADDWIPENFLESQLMCLGSSRIDVGVSKWGRFNVDDLTSFKEDLKTFKDNLTFLSWIKTYWKTASHMTPPGRVFIPKNIIQIAGLWDESLTLNDDFEFFTRIFNVAENIIYNNNTIFYYRSYIGGLSSKTNSFINQHSNFTSLIKGITLALFSFPNNNEVKQCCANMLQNFIYENYPQNKPLLDSAIKYLEVLPTPNLKIKAGGWTAIFIKLFGWKLTKLLKQKVYA